MGQMVGNAIGAQFLGETHNAAEQQHAQNHDGGGDVSAEIGYQHHIRQEGNGGQHKQDDGKRIDKGSSQAVKGGIRCLARQDVPAVLQAAFLCLLFVIALLRNMKLLVQRIDVGICAVEDATMGNGTVLHGPHLGLFYDLYIIT